MYAVGSLATILKSGKVFAVGEIETLLEVEGTDAKANAKVNVTTTTTTTTTTPTTKPNSNKRRKISTQGRVRVRFLGNLYA
jgi:sugar (pentulose or hexulose) kinase